MNEYEVKVTMQALEQMKEIVHYISKDLMAPDAADNLLDKMKVEIRTRKLEVALWQKMSCFLANQRILNTR